MARDRVLTRAILISVAVHLVAVFIIGRTLSTRLNASVVKSPAPQRLMNVDLVKDPYADPPKPKPVAAKQPAPNEPKPRGIFAGLAATVFGPSPRAVRAPAPKPVARNAGGALNTGTPSKNGDIGISNGATPVGVVPGSDNGRGSGHGEGPGAQRADPPPPPVRPVYVQPAPPAPPPAPRKVARVVCEVSGLLEGPHCRNTRSTSFIEGDEPRRICDRCKAPEPPPGRVADRANPVLTRDVRPRVPDSIEEGLSLRTEIEYYVDADGGVSGVSVVRSSGNRDWDRAVCGAASQWRYNPAIQDGTPRRVKVTRSVACKT